jgi:hypothetical protein
MVAETHQKLGGGDLIFVSKKFVEIVLSNQVTQGGMAGKSLNDGGQTGSQNLVCETLCFHF